MGVSVGVILPIIAWMKDGWKSPNIHPFGLRVPAVYDIVFEGKRWMLSPLSRQGSLAFAAAVGPSTTRGQRWAKQVELSSVAVAQLQVWGHGPHRATKR